MIDGLELGTHNMIGIAIATALGIGARHLLRLFRQHLAATPVQIAISRRVRRAKQLLSDTQYSLTEFAFASGFGSVRRFWSCLHRVDAQHRSAALLPGQRAKDRVGDAVFRSGQRVG